MSAPTLLLIEALLVAATIVLLWRLRPYLGLAPLYIFVGSNQYLQTVLAATLYVTLPGGLSMSPGSVVLFPAALFAILLIYLTDDVPATRTLIYGIVLSNVTLTVLAAFTERQLRSPGTVNLLNIQPALFQVNPRVFVVGTLTLVADAVLIVVVYEALFQRLRRLRLFGRIVGALAIVLYFDALVFTVLSFGVNREAWWMLMGNLAGKTGAAVVYGGCLYAYFLVGRGDAGHGREPGAVRDVFTILTYRERYEAVSAEKALLQAEAARRQALHRQLQDEHQRLRAVIEATVDGMVLLGTEREILVANAQALDLLGLEPEPEAWIGLPLRALVSRVAAPAPDWGTAVGAEAARVRDDPAHRGEGELRVGQRALRWFNLPVTAGESSGGRLVVLRDVTRERAIDAMREDLIHTLVHDLRGPLTSIHGSLALLDLPDGGTADQRELLQTASRNVNGLLSLVAAILDLSTLESGAVPIRPSRIAVGELLRTSVALQAPAAAARRVRLETSGGDGVTLWADSGLIARVLQNLISNAIKFTPPGGVVRVSGVLDPALGDVTVTVADSGPGIEPSLEPRLFGKFATGMLPGRGSGLGLAFCRLAVEAHGGRIWLASTPGTSATFSFALPARGPEGPR